MFPVINSAPSTSAMRVLPTTGAQIPCVLNGRFLTHCGPSRPDHQFPGGRIGMRISGKFETRIPGRFETPMGGKVGANMQIMAATVSITPPPTVFKAT